jgi:hypothetical protein
MRLLRSRALALVLPLAVLLVSVLAWLAIAPDLLIAWMDEGGLVEEATVLLYLATVGALLAASGRLPRGVGPALAIVMLAFAAREADWHIRFTGTSMLRVSFYLGPAPLAQKLASLVIVGLALAAAAYLALHFMRHWRSRDPAARTAAAFTVAFVASMVLAKVLDRSLSILVEDLGFAGGNTWRALQVTLEEPLELVLPLLVLAGLWQYCALRPRTAIRGSA